MRPSSDTQTVLVTGASSGIGKATADLFAREGFRVFGTSRRPRTQTSGVEPLELDVRSEASVERCVATVLARTGRIDVLVNNAGTPGLGLIEEASLEAAHHVLETNLFGAIRMARAVLPSMRARRQGRIINIGSLSAWIGEPGDGFYSASKHALAGATGALRHEVWPFGIHVSLVEPGEFRTGFLEEPSTGTGSIPEYDSIRDAVTRTFNDALRKGDDPAKAAKRVMKVARARSPRFRYGVGRGSYLPYLTVLAPPRLLDLLVRKGFGLTRRMGASPLA